MLEARLVQGSLLKKIIEALRELVTDANLECNESGISMQAMDSSHVSLCSVQLKAEGFDHFRCDKPTILGINTVNLSKILKCAGNDDVITIRNEEGTDGLVMVFESPSQERISDFELKLMDIESEQLGIPETEYKCFIRLPSAEFQRIIRDLTILGDTCTIAITKEGIRFTASGDLGTGNIMLKHNTTSDKPEERVEIEMLEPVELNFALRYLNFFTKATSLAPVVAISMTPDAPIVVEYGIDTMGHIKFYLAPKIDEDS